MAVMEHISTGSLMHLMYQTDERMTVIVPSGTYYRVRGYHAASNGGVKESTSTLTQGIKVS